MYKSIVLKPRLSEQSYAMAQARTYVFDVPKSSNKHTVARAIAAQYDVEVINVNIANISGKAKRTIRKGGRVSRGTQADFKKAFITLKEGHSLPVFAAIEEEEAKQEATQEKIDKVAAKQAEKEVKKEAKPTRRGLLHVPGRRGARGGNK